MDRLHDDENTVVDEEIVYTVVKTSYTSGVNEAEHTRGAVGASTDDSEMIMVAVISAIVLIILAVVTICSPPLGLILIGLTLMGLGFCAAVSNT